MNDQMYELFNEYFASYCEAIFNKYLCCHITKIIRRDDVRSSLAELDLPSQFFSSPDLDKLPGMLMGIHVMCESDLPDDKGKCSIFIHSVNESIESLRTGELKQIYDMAIAGTLSTCTSTVTRRGVVQICNRKSIGNKCPYCLSILIKV